MFQVSTEKNWSSEFLFQDKLGSDFRKIEVSVLMFMDRNFSEMGHLKALGFLIFHVQGSFSLVRDKAEGQPRLRSC